MRTEPRMSHNPHRLHPTHVALTWLHGLQDYCRPALVPSPDEHATRSPRQSAGKFKDTSRMCRFHHFRESHESETTVLHHVSEKFATTSPDQEGEVAGAIARSHLHRR